MKLTPSMRRILIALDREGDMDAAEIADAACVSANTLSGGGYLTKLLVLRLIRVSRWQRQEGSSGPPRPVYSTTPGENARKPRPYTNGQKSRRWKKRVAYRSAQWKATQALKELANLKRTIQ